MILKQKLNYCLHRKHKYYVMLVKIAIVGFIWRKYVPAYTISIFTTMTSVNSVNTWRRFSYTVSGLCATNAVAHKMLIQHSADSGSADTRVHSTFMSYIRQLRQLEQRTRRAMSWQRGYSIIGSGSGFTVNLVSDSLGKSNDLGVSSVSRIHFGFGFIVTPDQDPIIE